MQLEKSAEAIVEHTARRAESFSQGAVWDISMNVVRQQGITKQLSLFQQVGSVIRPVDFGEAGSGSETKEEQQAFTATDRQRALTQNLMERVVHPSNMVSKDGFDQPNQQVLVVKQLKETAGYVERMPGGVRGGGREAPLYSIAKPLNRPNKMQAQLIDSKVVTKERKKDFKICRISRFRYPIRGRLWSHRCHFGILVVPFVNNS
jgi:hypothetical protein